jgi:hypothetical protein
MNLVRSAGMSLNAFAAVRYLLSRPDDRARQFEGRFPALEIPVPIYQRESVPETEPVRPRALLTILLNRYSRGFPVPYTAEKCTQGADQADARINPTDARADFRTGSGTRKRPVSVSSTPVSQFIPSLFFFGYMHQNSVRNYGIN